MHLLKMLNIILFKCLNLKQNENNFYYFTGFFLKDTCKVEINSNILFTKHDTTTVIKNTNLPHKVM